MRRATKSRSSDDTGDKDTAAASLRGLYSSPEFLIRRAHQVASAAFTEACADLHITPSQYAVLFALREYAPIGQNALGRLVALDRSTTSLVVKSLKDRQFVVASSDPADHRKISLQLSELGRLHLAKAERRCQRANEALLAAFEPEQAAHFLQMLQRLAASRSETGAGAG